MNKDESLFDRGKHLAPERSMALVIVLAFMVLLSAVLVTLLSQSILHRQIGQSSMNEANVSLFATAAANTTVSDLELEITTNSAVWISGTNTVYFPGPSGATFSTNIALNFASATNNVPARVGTADALPNLVKVSTAGAAFCVNGPARASSVLTTTVSRNGRKISLARWNKPLLLPKATPSSTTDLTPVGSFTAPAWILVNRLGGNPTTFSTNLCWSSDLSNTNVVMGRYAYAIYDEGGLLDANVAGYPDSAAATTNTAPPNPLPYKSSLALADLKYTGLNQSQINALVGWRNNASLAVSGSFPNYNFSSVAIAATNYFNFTLTNNTGFLAPANGALNPDATANQSDHLFISRQQLIDFLTSSEVSGLGTSGSLAQAQNALQYLGTFSRDLEQPAFDPSDRPAVADTRVSTGAEGGNDYYQHDADANPVLLTQRVTTQFTRSDGSIAVVGEPLLKKRFPLSRLALITHTAKDSGTGNIYNYFGLKRTSSASPWVYNHGTSTAGWTPSESGGVGSFSPNSEQHILNLAQVAALGREPDFFEILKAVISVGSLGKGAFFEQCTTSPVLAREQLEETQTDYQIIQIGLNMIDQTTATDFPTSVTFSDETMQGVKNLPYLWGMMMMMLETNDATHATVIWTPWVWDPLDPAQNSSASAPTKFRAWASSGTGTLTLHAVTPTIFSPAGATESTTFSPTSSSAWLQFQNVASEVNSDHFRFPVRLMSANTGGLSGSFTTIKPQSFTTHQNYDGLLTTPSFYYNWAAAAAAGTADTEDKMYPYFANGFYVELDYYDGSNWLPYDHQTFFGNDVGCGNFLSETRGTYVGCVMRIDPRTARWGNNASMPNYTLAAVQTAANGDVQAYTPDYSGPMTWDWYMGYNNPLPGTGNPVGVYPGRNPTGTPNNHAHGWITASTAGNTFTRWATYPAQLSMNIVVGASTLTTANGFSFATRDSFTKTCYYDDPDGIARRATAWYAKDETETPFYDDSTYGSAGRPDTAPLSRRPIVLNRPFRSIAELGYASRGMPWKNIDFTFPESGDSALLEAFCLNDTPDSSGLVAGRVNLNTRQAPVLAALVGGAYQDELLNSATSAGVTGRGTPGPLGSNGGDSTLALQVAQTLVNRTTSLTAPLGPLRNRAELVGKPIPQTTGNDPLVRYSGFAGDIQTVLTANSSTSTPAWKISRMREAAVRALAGAGTARVWNLLIDIVAQTGRYPVGATDASDFLVEGEKRLWVHVAIDRLTGRILDEYAEPVNE